MVVVMVLLLGVPVITYFMLKQHKVQTLIVQKVLRDLSEKTGTHITAEKVKFSFFHDLVLENVFVADQQNDTLLFTTQLSANFDSLNVINHQVHLSKLKLENPVSRVKMYDKNSFNFSFLIDSLAPKDSTNTQKWDVSLKNINIKNGDLAFYGKRKYHLLHTGLDVALLSHEKDSLNLKVKYIEFEDTAGIVLKDLTAHYIMTPNKVTLSDLILETSNSNVTISNFDIEAENVWKNLFDENTKVNIEVNSARIASADVKRFYRDFARISEKLYFSGQISGTVGDLRGDNLLLSAGDAFDLLFDFNVSGLPDYKNAFIHTDFKRLFITPRYVIPDLEVVMKKTLPMKKEILKFGRILYAGTLTGFVGDFVAYGELNSELGSINTDVALRDNIRLEKIELSGNLSTEGFNLGALLDKPDEIGFASLNIEMEADKPYNQYMSMFLNGEISSLDFHGYNYSNIFLRGVVGNKHFNGGVNINDPNLALLFTGRVDFSGELPIFDFEADVRKIAPYQLNFSKKFENGIVNATVKTKLKGNQLDNLEGFLGVYNFNFSNRNGEVAFDNATLFFNKEADKSTIQINSDWLEGQISGQYKFNDLGKSVSDIIRPFLPTLASTISTQEFKGVNRFTYNFKLKDIDKLANVLELPFSVSSDGDLYGEVDDYNDVINMNLMVHESRFKNFMLDGLKVSTQKINDKSINLDLNLERVQLNKKFIENVALNLVSNGDSLSNKLTWKNKSEVAYMGELNTGLTFQRVDGDMLRTTIAIHPSFMVLSDTSWNFSESRIIVDTTGVDIFNFLVESDERYLKTDGKLSKLESDTFKLNVEGFELEYLFRFLNLKNLLMQGQVTGESTIRAALGTPVIESEFLIKDFVINRVYLGDLDLASSWDQENRQMNIIGENMGVDNQSLLISGAYFPKNDSLALLHKLNHLPVQYIQPYLEVVMQNLKGDATGEILLAGNVKHLKLLGNVFLKDGSFDIGYLNTKYFLDDTISFTNDAIEFNNIVVRDEKGNKGHFGGVLKHKTFKDMEFDMFMDFDNMLALNTRSRDNDLYYGTVYATGVLSITGKGSKVHMDINARTEDNSEIYLPLTSSEVASDNNFVRFVSSNDTIKEVVEEVQVDESGFSFNMEVEATPNAKVELIFDSRIGDIIKGQGIGSLVFSYDSKADFKMFGDYTVTSGEYLFTAQNVINKRFDIESGGVIKWSGDPYLAIIDLNANYRTKASIYDLLPGTTDDLNKSLRIPVNCHMALKENLMSPSIGFDIVLPTADQETQQSVRNVLNSEGEVQRQVIYLLMFNRFYTPDYLRSAHQSYASNSNQSQAAVVTGSEFLSNQLSNWLSQISDDFDLGVNYRPADELTSQEVEVMLSTQMFNDRLTINGNLGYRDNKFNNSTSNFVGDFDVDYRLDKKGNFKLKAYTHSNDNLLYRNTPTTQGVGFVYKEEFDSFGELIQRYKSLLTKNDSTNVAKDVK